MAKWLNDAMAKLPRGFFARDTRLVARALLGMRLVRLLPDGTRLSGRIVETEAYRPGDAAAHAYRGRTARNASMFLVPGAAYVYFTYGMHFCFNVVTEAEDTPAAVLVRALAPLEGIEWMRQNRTGRAKPVADRDLCRGPARLCRALGIDRAFDGYDLCRREARLFLELDEAVPDDRVSVSPRVGVGGDAQARAAEWRWFTAGDPHVSR
jgi:DNA-3-methyladenine glycosylase